MKALDLFAGAGGSSLGAELAGLTVVAAVNHWPVAVRSHEANHPAASHYCEDAFVVDPTKLPRHDVLLASPSCTGHTRARGKDLPRHDTARSTAWCVLRVAEVHRSKLVIVENVPELLRWANDFVAFLEDMGPRPSPQHSIDRINNDGDYEPSNCRWATFREQIDNRSVHVSRLIEWRGETRSLAEWSRILSIKFDTLSFRLKKGLSVEQAFTTPVLAKGAPRPRSGYRQVTAP